MFCVFLSRIYCAEGFGRPVPRPEDENCDGPGDEPSHAIRGNKFQVPYLYHVNLQKLIPNSLKHTGLLIHITLMRIGIHLFSLIRMRIRFFNFNVDPDPAPHQIDANLSPLTYGTHTQIRQGSIVSTGLSELPSILRILILIELFTLMRIRDPAFQNNADPDQQFWSQRHRNYFTFPIGFWHEKKIFLLYLFGRHKCVGHSIAMSGFEPRKRLSRYQHSYCYIKS
jgi:hypothetical protein